MIVLVHVLWRHLVWKPLFQGEGDVALLVHQGEVQRMRNRFQLSVLDVAIISQERFEEARFTLPT